jgi:hypothetical protein
MTSLHQCLNQESAVASLHSRWSSSSQVVVDRPPSQPLSRRRMCGGPSSGSVKQSHIYPEMGDIHRRENTFEQHQQQSNSKWTSGSGLITDRPPLQPLSRRGRDVGRIQQSDSRWSPGSRATSDTALSRALARHRMLVGPSNVSDLKHSVERRNQDLFQGTIKRLFTSPLLEMSQSRAPNVTGTGLQLAARTA